MVGEVDAHHPGARLARHAKHNRKEMLYTCIHTYCIEKIFTDNIFR